LYICTFNNLPIYLQENIKQLLGKIAEKTTELEAMRQVTRRTAESTAK